ncbi:MAG: GNAT family N-acetyltransferase [Ilumatobacter sp.]|uniref:GNAT family N-acetyltransferase n=1 Tax=Ilumatobacter sp. TaxID=1967498 RepID=UPI003C787EE8
MGMRLRPLLLADEAEFRRIHSAMDAEHFEFGLGLDEATSWVTYIDALDEMRRGNVQPGFVPATFLVAVVDDEIVGRTSIRHELNDFLAHEGGHIGYGVALEHRRRGHATEILRQSVIVGRSHGVDRALVVCNEDNVASAAVIESCGGVLESVVDGADGVRKKRYWID